MTRHLRFSGASNAPLAQNAAHNFAARHALCHYASNSIFTFIPKNACSTIRLSLAIANGCIPNTDRHVWIHKNNATFAASLRDLATARFTCVVLRDPFTRLSSVYLDKIVNRDREFWHFNDLTNRQFDPDEITFRKFVELIANPQMLRADIHWRPQVDFLVYDDYDLWGCFERFREFQTETQIQTGMKIEDARSLTLHGTDRFKAAADGRYADATPAELRTMNREGIVPEHRAMYDLTLHKSVSKAYAADIELYRNCFPNDSAVMDLDI